MESRTFEVEVAAVSLEHDREALQMAKELGLDGQAELLGVVDEESTMPYAPINSAHRKILFAMFPEQCSVDQFKDGVMPLEVMKCVAFLKENHPDGKVLVRWGSFSDQKWLLHDDGSLRLVASWGTDLQQLGELSDVAHEHHKDQYIREVRRIIGECEQLIASAERHGVKLDSRMPSFYS